MPGRTINPDDYELHQVEREELNEAWIWLRKKELEVDIENRRPALHFKFESKWGKCCETLYADNTYLENRHNPIRVGTITAYDEGEKRFKLSNGGKWIVLTNETECRWYIAEEPLRDGLVVIVSYRKNEETTAEIIAKEVSFGTNNLVFMNGWYRNQLGIPKGKIPRMITLRVKPPRWRLRAVWWQVRASARHPQIAVVMSTVLAIVGAGLGLAGLTSVVKEMPWLKGITMMLPWVPWGELREAIAGLGVIVFLAGFVPLFLRATTKPPER